MIVYGILQSTTQKTIKSQETTRMYDEIEYTNSNYIMVNGCGIRIIEEPIVLNTKFSLIFSNF